MKFNTNKVNFCNMEKNRKQKTSRIYNSYDSNIDNTEQVRDLGIMMSNTATFTLHIRNIVIKARYKINKRVLRVFQSRKGLMFTHSSKLLSFPYQSTTTTVESMEGKDIQVIEVI